MDPFARFAKPKAKFKGCCWQKCMTKCRNFDQALNLELDVEDQACYQATCFYQYLFYAQFYKLKAYAHKKNVEIMGDIPILSLTIVPMCGLSHSFSN